MDPRDILLFSFHVGVWTLWTILIRLSRTGDSYPYAYLGTILLTEVVKFLLSLFFHLTSIKWTNVGSEMIKIVQQFHIGIYFAVPSFIYALYNALFYFNLIHFDPTSYRVLINMRILWSGVLFQIFFNKRMSLQRWIALFILLLGCAVNQVGPNFAIETSFWFLLSIVVQSLMSSLGGVYNEFLLKKNVDISLNVKNMYLYFFSIVFYFIAIIFHSPQLLVPENFFHGYSTIVYVLIFVGSFCGFSTALFLRHMNIILKEYAHSGEMILTAVLAYMLFGTEITPSLIASIVLVTISIMLFNSGHTTDIVEKKGDDVGIVVEQELETMNNKD